MREALAELGTTVIKLVESHSTDAAQYRPINTVAEVRRSLLAELDFSQELRNTRSFAHHFHDDPSVGFAEVFPEFSTQRVLTMEFLEGTSLSQIETLKADNCDLQNLAAQGAGVFLDMVFRDGFFLHGSAFREPAVTPRRGHRRS